MDFTHHILGFNWKGQGKDLQPVCKIRDLGTGETADLILDSPARTPNSSDQNYLFNWQLSEKFYCPGYYDGQGSQVTCPNHSEIEAKYDRCASCDRQDGFRAAFFFGEEPEGEFMQAHMEKQHYIYLAVFFPNIVKVGTAVEGRQYIRLIEQDALYANLIATASGTEIQQLEAKIAKCLNLPRSVTSKKKQAGLYNRINETLAQKFLSSHFARLKSNPEIQKTLMKQAETISFTEYNHIKYLEKQTTVVEHPELLAGTFFSLRGKYLILESANQLLQYTTDQIVNRYLYHSEQPLKPKIPTKTQQSLF